MPFKQEIHTLDSVILHLMHFDAFDPNDYLDHLTEQETERYFSFTHPKRRMEFVATRILRHRIFGFEHIHYTPLGAPYIQDEGFISISHAKGVVGIALSEAFPVGLDLEKIDARILTLSSKFLSPDESIKLDTSSMVEMTKVWSGKEALYKIAGRKGILFRTELHLEPLSNNRWQGRIHTADKILRTEISIFTLDDLVVSVTTHALNEE